MGSLYAQIFLGSVVAGEVPVFATNDGKHYGPNGLFRFVGTESMSHVEFLF